MKDLKLREHISKLIDENIDLLKIYTVYKKHYSQNQNTIKYYEQLIFKTKQNIMALNYALKCIDKVVGG